MDFFGASTVIFRHGIAKPYLESRFMFNSILMYWYTLLIFCVASKECTSSPLIAPSVRFIIQKSTLMFWWTMVDTREYQR